MPRTFETLQLLPKQSWFRTDQGKHHIKKHGENQFYKTKLIEKRVLYEDNFELKKELKSKKPTSNVKVIWKMN
jgi:hypothetical protein